MAGEDTQPESPQAQKRQKVQPTPANTVNGKISAAAKAILDALVKTHTPVNHVPALSLDPTNTVLTVATFDGRLRLFSLQEAIAKINQNPLPNTAPTLTATHVIKSGVSGFPVGAVFGPTTTTGNGRDHQWMALGLPPLISLTATWTFVRVLPVDEPDRVISVNVFTDGHPPMCIESVHLCPARALLVVRLNTALHVYRFHPDDRIHNQRPVEIALVTGLASGALMAVAPALPPLPDTEPIPNDQGYVLYPTSSPSSGTLAAVSLTDGTPVEFSDGDEGRRTTLAVADTPLTVMVVNTCLRSVLMATAAADSSVVCLWNLGALITSATERAESEPRVRFTVPDPDDQPVAVCFTPDGGKLCCATAAGAVYVWRLAKQCYWPSFWNLATDDDYDASLVPVASGRWLNNGDDQDRDHHRTVVITAVCDAEASETSEASEDVWILVATTTGDGGGSESQSMVRCLRLDPTVESPAERLTLRGTFCLD